jgi:hypothetical protein
MLIPFLGVFLAAIRAINEVHGIVKNYGLENATRGTYQPFAIIIRWSCIFPRIRIS